MTRKSYGASRKAEQGGVFEFELGGENFDVPLPIPAIALTDLALSAGDMDNEEGQIEAAAAASQFFSIVLDDKDHTRFRRANKKARLEIEELMGLVMDIVGEGVGHPTLPQSVSQATSSSTGTGSAAVATSPASEAP